jgi:CRISPR-associated protein Csm4
MITYKLHFTAPLHLSARHDGFEKTHNYLHSDTLFSAIVSNWSHLYDEAPETLIKSEGFVISSAFPFVGERFYFPKPYSALPVRYDASDNGLEKKLRKVEFVEQGLFEKLIGNLEVQGDKLLFSKDGNFLATGSVPRAHCVEREMGRNMIDRVTGQTDIFYFSEISFLPNAGLFFLAHFIDDNIRKKFEATLRLLGDEGIGSDRSVGKGLFSVEVIDDFPLAQPANPNSFLTLSLYHPTEEEIKSDLLKRSAYHLVSRGGWITAPGFRSLRRQSLNMFLEGSVFSALEQGSYGDIPVVAGKIDGMLDFDVYRYGKAFALHCIMGEDNG